VPVREELRGKAMRELFSPPSLSNITFCLTLNRKTSVLKTIKKFPYLKVDGNEK
jgi:hypothetical protein